jgi:sec-independent protein translocase protein TatA
VIPAFPLFPGVPGGPELLIVLFVVVLLFGANRVPELARASGRAIGEFRRGREEIERELRAVAEPPADDAASAAPGRSSASTRSGDGGTPDATRAAEADVDAATGTEPEPETQSGTEPARGRSPRRP